MEKIAFPNETGMPRRTRAMVTAEVRRLHDTVGLSYQKISLLEPFNNIPQSSINAIGRGEIPHKWLKQLSIPVPVPIMPCPTHGVVHVGKCPDPLPSKYERTPGGWVCANNAKRAAKKILMRAQYSVDELIHELILQSHEED
jgi:hypothetical protein